MSDRGTLDSAHWVLDKRVPLALIIAILVQTAGAIWWAASISSRVTSLEAQRMAVGDQGGRIIRLETQIETLTVLMRRIEDKLDKALDRP